MDAIVLLIVFVVSAITCITAYTLGLIAGQRLSKGKEIKLFDPPKKVDRHDVKEVENYKTMIENIDNYDGTSIGQKPLRR
jgi:hypothetical protein